MELKKIYNNGTLTHEYFVNESDTDEVLKKLNFDNDLKDNLNDYLKNHECILVQKGDVYTLESDGVELSATDFETSENTTTPLSFKKNKDYGFKKK